jgi:cytochrome c6
MNKREVVAIVTAAAIVLMALPVLADGPDAAAIFKSKCAMCHAADGSGNTPTGKSMKVRDLRSEEIQKMKDEELEKVIESGKAKMPAYKTKLSGAEIDALVKYIRDLGKKK